MLEATPRAFREPSEEVVEKIATHLEDKLADVTNEYENQRYRISIDDSDDKAELGRITIYSIYQYAPDGDVGADGEWDTEAGPADYHYEKAGTLVMVTS
ncbi:MAG: hypothetical protein KBD21_05610 [Candidatus Pacebacteria bacterium]|nr:hypothetical protein [Candidatus Paceibacterota bacterium]